MTLSVNKILHAMTKKKITPIVGKILLAMTKEEIILIVRKIIPIIRTLKRQKEA